MHNFLRNLNFLFFFLLSLNFNSYSHAHIRGTFSSKQEVENRSLEIACQGTHKNQDKWLPCKNEKELHMYLENR